MVKVILDTDTDNEIDDQYALSYLIKSNRVEVLGITAAPYLNSKVSTAKEGMEKSFDEIIHIVSLCHMVEKYKDKIFKGSTSFLEDAQTPLISDSALKIVELAQDFTKEEPLYILAIGALTNVASAILIDPSICSKIHVVFLGGVAEHLTFEAKLSEFNMREDVLAAQIVFKNVEELTLLPCAGVVSELKTSQCELEHWLKGKNPLCDYLVTHTIEEANRYAYGKPWTRTIWDISAVSYLFNKSNKFMSVREMKRLYPINACEYSVIEELTMNYVYLINRDEIFEDMFQVLVK